MGIYRDWSSNTKKGANMDACKNQNISETEFKAKIRRIQIAASLLLVLSSLLALFLSFLPTEKIPADADSVNVNSILIYAFGGAVLLGLVSAWDRAKKEKTLKEKLVLMGLAVASYTIIIGTIAGGFWLMKNIDNSLLAIIGLLAGFAAMGHAWFFMRPEKV